MRNRQKIIAIHLLVFLSSIVALVRAEESWKTIKDGFEFKLPADWRKIETRGIDSHVGEYRGATAFLTFDEVYGLGYTVEKSTEFIEKLKSKERDSSLLKSGEEIWRVDGRIASFTIGKREFQNVATLTLSYEGLPSYLSIQVFFASDDDAPIARKILRSLTWPKKDPYVKTSP